MSLQFSRNARVEIAGVDSTLFVEGLRIKFEVVRTSLGYPNKGKIEIYNLDERKLEQVVERLAVVRLFAGYGGESPMIYEADIANHYKSRIGVDSVYTLITGSGRRAWETDTFSKTYAIGVDPAIIVGDVVASFPTLTPGVVALSDAKTKLQPLTLSGNSHKVMDKLAKDYNFDWHIDQNQIDVIGRGLTVDDRPVYDITPLTGLIGSPTLTELGADFRILLNPDILVGRQVRMDSVGVQLAQAALEFRKVRTTANGFYKVKETRFIGDTRGQEWYTDIIGWRVADEPRKNTD